MVAKSLTGSFGEVADFQHAPTPQPTRSGVADIIEAELQYQACRAVINILHYGHGVEDSVSITFGRSKEEPDMLRFEIGPQDANAHPLDNLRAMEKVLAFGKSLRHAAGRDVEINSLSGASWLDIVSRPGDLTKMLAACVAADYPDNGPATANINALGHLLGRLADPRPARELN